MSNDYLTVEKNSVYEMTERKSKFIGYAGHVVFEEDALNFINEIKNKHKDARHNVYAYSVKYGDVTRYSDDGEPSGTAGIPILNVIKKRNIKNVVVVITRYFGGILLGTGGLIRAYSNAANMALNLAKEIKMYLCYDCSVFCDYNQYGKISNIISEYGGIIDDSKFYQNIELKFHLKKENFLELSKKILESFSGNLICTVLNEDFYKF